MKKIIFCLLFTLIYLCNNAQPVNLHGQLSVLGTQLVDKENKPFALHGISFGWSCFWPRFYTAGTVHALYRNWNCNVVRAAMGVEPDKGYIKDSASSINLITTVVDAAIQEGIYVIIDWHSHNINLAEAKIFFKNIATKYHQYPNIIYELFNEPDYETWAEVKAYSEELIKIIRAIDKKNIILVGSPHWDQDVNLPAADPIKNETNLMYTMHFYAGTHKQYLRDRTDSAIAKGLPIFVSESAGMEATGDGNINYDEWQKWITWMDDRKLSWVTWSLSDKDETCSMLKPSANSNGKWKEEDIKESGLKIKEFLKKY